LYRPKHSTHTAIKIYKYVPNYLSQWHIITFGFKTAIFIYAFASSPKIQILSNVIYITEDKKIKFEGT